MVILYARALYYKPPKAARARDALPGLEPQRISFGHRHLKGPIFLHLNFALKTGPQATLLFYYLPTLLLFLPVALTQNSL